MAIASDILRCDRLRADQVAGARLVLCDLDGCLVSEGRAFPDAQSFVETCGDRLWIVSNNSTHTATALAAALRDIGMDIPAQRILLAGEQSLHHLRAKRPELTVSLFASDMLRDAARAIGLRLVDRDPQIVLLCRDLGFAIPSLARAVAHLQAGARLWVSNTDGAHPAQDGRPVPETGALLAAIRAVAGPVEFDSIGKPHAHMAQLALQRAGVAAGNAVFVGDSEATDGALARAAGLTFVHLVRGAAA